MARLTTRGRDRIKRSNFALPERIHTGKRGAKITKGAYPITDAKHGRSALARASHDESRRTYLKIARKVHRKFPGIKIKALETKR